MVLAGVGDAMGYRNGSWEFNYDGEDIHKQLERLGGISKLDIVGCCVSDDQVMHLHTAEALIAPHESVDQLYDRIAQEYVKSFDDMSGRGPGPQTGQSVYHIRGGGDWRSIRYTALGGGCGAAMRSMCIGLRYVGEDQRDKLIATSIESGRMTHNHPTGFFGSLASSLFTAYAIENVPVVEWGRKLLEILPRAYKYLEDQKRFWTEYQKDLRYFEEVWTKYLESRDILKKGHNVPKFPEPYGVKERDAFYKSVSWRGWGGASGHDAPMIAYDALLGAGDNWEQLALRGILHGGGTS
eukprot:TRINITY_DN22272_c0_g1_i1.p2 TRINITY_DN22272_c0_g1~~TRINITY_DN22272_c0_g1_i1.p2  ORF type:complete len:296 (+),score=71.25 TRINITY_DN22272_c0_g1_i1:994-1881(+)